MKKKIPYLIGVCVNLISAYLTFTFIDSVVEAWTVGLITSAISIGLQSDLEKQGFLDEPQR